MAYRRFFVATLVGVGFAGGSVFGQGLQLGLGPVRLSREVAAAGGACAGSGCCAHGHSWFAHPSARVKRYVQPGTHTLGLHNLYPTAQQFGHELRRDPDVVDALSAADRSASAVESPAQRQARFLLREKRYSQAAQVLAGEIRAGGRSSLSFFLLSAALLGARQFSDAENLLREAIDSAETLEFLSGADAAALLPEREELKKAFDAQGLDASKGTETLIHGVFLLLVGDGARGVSVLRELQGKDAAARRVYLEFIDRALPQPAVPVEPKGPSEPRADEKKPEARPDAKSGGDPKSI